jgi:hypothetical protein
VAKNGNDAWSGRLAEPNTPKTDGPFATLARSRDEIRAMKKTVGLPPRGVTVLVRAGTYELGATFQLAAVDSGAEASPIVYRAYNDERPVLTGGRRVTGFQPYRDAILKADVAAQGFQGIYFRQLYSFQRDAHNWEASQALHCGPEWRQGELGIKLPAPGDRDYQPTMKEFFFRIDFASDSGPFWLDDVSLREAESLDPWQAWQASGQDRHSLLADPLFVDAAKDDYRLRPESPAFKLGFKPIPMEKIGPYADPLRATWPIAEAPGVRENPLPAETPVNASP